MHRVLLRTGVLDAPAATHDAASTSPIGIQDVGTAAARVYLDLVPFCVVRREAPDFAERSVEVPD